LFTGLIKEIGTIKSIRSNAEGKEITISSSTLLPEIMIDDSVAINGCCLTATKINSNSFRVQAIHVTLDKTIIGTLKPGSKVNMELALRAMDRLGGHFVQGHVNGIGEIKNINSRGKNYEVSIEVPSDIKKYLIQEGSIAIDGISLTLAKVDSTNIVSVSIIPHTWDNTILNTKKAGSVVNIEVDVLAKYIENFMNIKKNEKLNQESLINFLR
jgi:riboflavin synthase